MCRGARWTRGNVALGSMRVQGFYFIWMASYFALMHLYLQRMQHLLVRIFYSLEKVTI